MEKLEKILSQFVSWTKIKIRLHIAPDINFYFHEREIWWASLGVNVGFEEDGKNERFERPVLVFKKFSKDIFWALPLTSKNKKGKYYYQVEYAGEKYQIILSQLRLISSKRLTRKIRTLPKSEFDEVREKVKSFI